MSYNPYIRHVYNPARNFGADTESSSGQSAANILSEMPNANTSNASNSSNQTGNLEKYFPLLYKTLFGKDLEEKLAAKERQLEYLEMAIQQFPATSGALQPQVTMLKKEIRALKLKSFYYASVRVAILVGGVSLAGATIYSLVKLPSAISKIGSGGRYE